MIRYVLKLQIVALALVTVSLVSCDDDDVKPSLRTKVEYATLDAGVAYSDQFMDAGGTTTVDLKDGNHRHKMFQALNYYSSSSIAAGAEIDAAKLKAIFSNTGDPFTDISTSSISVSGAELNASEVQLKDKVASSFAATDASAVRAHIESLFDDIDAASASLGQAAAPGQAGKVSNYLVDEKGLELIQVIQKSLIGALQLDYIGNTLMDAGLDAENYELVSGKNYSQLEHNWDEAYGFLTLNPIYLAGATSLARNSIEFGAGSYIWEYNRANFATIYPAFLRGRAAIVNNDRAELEVQALYIRTQFEKAIAAAALGYLKKWKDNTDADHAVRIHAIGEGLGFVYSLRFAKIHGADAAFSEGLLNTLVGSENGFWDLTADKINTASDAIRQKFGIQ